MTATSPKLPSGGPAPQPAARRPSGAPGPAGARPGRNSYPADPTLRVSRLVRPSTTAPSASGGGATESGLPVAVSRVALSIPEVPVPKQRARWTLRRGRVHTYIPAATLAAERRIRGHARSQLGEGWRPLVGPVRLSFTAYLHMPRDITKRLQTTTLPVRRPDLDNFSKLLMDALTPGQDPCGVWGDNSQVVEIHARKEYARDRPPGWEVVIESLDQPSAEAGAATEDLRVRSGTGGDDGGPPRARDC